jgi:cytohesin
MAPQRLRDLFVSLSPWRRESAFVELSRQRSWDAVEHLVACYDSRAIARRALLSRARAQVIEAVRLGDEKGVRWLINFGVSANVVSRAGRSSSLLHYAVRSNHYAVAKLLLLSGAKVNAQDVDGRSPLYHAVFSSDVDMTRLLLQNGADVKTMDTQGCNALMVAVGNQHLDIVKLLLSAGADPAAYSKSISHIDSQLPLFIAVTEGNMEIFECLLAQEECRINLCDVRTGNSLLMHAIEQGRLVMVWELLHHPDHLDVLHKNHKGMTALQFSVDKGFLDVARYLLANGARPNLTDGLRCSAWDRALEKYAYEWIELFWQAGADVAQRSHRDGSTIFTCLNAIICQEDSRVNQCLVKLYNKGFVPTPVDLKNVKNFRFRYRRYLRGHTISHQILMKCQHRTDAAEALLQAAKDGNVAKVRERLAVYRKEGRDASDPQEQDVRPLLNYRNVASMSPLMWAAHHGSLSVAQVLVEAGANINLSGPRGRTALYYAARAGHLPMVQFLLKQGANFAQKSDFDFSALDVAERYGREKIVRFLQIVAKLPADSCQLVRQSPAKLRVQPSLSQLFAHQVGGEMAGGAETKREEVRRPSPSRFDRFT